MFPQLFIYSIGDQLVDFQGKNSTTSTIKFTLYRIQLRILIWNNERLNL